MHDVVEELGADGRPGGVGIVVRLDDGGESGVEPGDDAGVNLCPLGVEEHGARVDGAVDMIFDAELAEHNVEEGAPDGEVGVANTQSHRDMSLDVDQLRRRGCDGDRCGDAKWVAIVRAGARRHG